VPRIPYANLDELPADVRERVGRFGVLNITRMMAHTGETLVPWTEVIHSLLTSKDPPPALRELAILRVGYRLDCAYEYEQHVGVACKVGLSEEAIRAVRTPDPDAAALGRDGRAVVEVVDQLLATGHVGDDAFAAVREVLGDDSTVRLLLVIGCYVATAYVLNGTQVELDETARVSLD
jgi:alkylhydroperoxidase family enzyme